MQDNQAAPDGTSIHLELLADLHTALVQATDERALVLTLASYLESWQPSKISLLYFDLDASGAPDRGWVAAAWADGKLHEGPLPESARFRMADFGLSAVWAESPHQPLTVPDIQTDPRADDMLQKTAQASGYRGLMVLPLYSESNGGWQGMVTVNWAEPRGFSSKEYAVGRLLMASLASHVGGRRSQEALRVALAEAELLHEVSQRLNSATSLPESLAALAQPAPLHDELDAVLCSYELNAQGEPETLVVMQGWTAGQYQGAPVGTRIPLGDLPFARLYLSSPNEPLLLGDIQNDPRVDERSRAMYASLGVRATILMSLMLQGRWVGLLNLSWQQPMQFGERERRIYRSLSKQAALLTDNRMMLDRLRASLDESEQRRSMLRTLLDHLPVGVALFSVSTGGRVWANPAALRLLGRPEAPDGLTEVELEEHHLVRPGSDQDLTEEELPPFQAMRTGKMHSREADMLLPSGERLHLDLIAAPVHDEAGVLQNVVVMLSDVTARKRAELERARLQEEVIRVQAATLAERSSPLIPITDDILVLPLIGSLDTERGHQVMDTLLSGTSKTRARVAIIDITGVRTVDTQAASALTNAAQALRLLGVEPVLTGIRPEVAQTLIGLGVRLDGITTRSTLQSGIQYALRRLGRQGLQSPQGAPGTSPGTSPGASPRTSPDTSPAVPKLKAR